MPKRAMDQPVHPDRLQLRPATPEDVPAIHSFYRSLSAESLLMRFFVATRDDPALERAAHIGLPETSLVLVALATEGEPRVVGEARYELTNGGWYEFGLVVLDEYRGQGLGSMLLHRLRREASRRGVRVLRGLVRTDNTRMLHMLLKIGCAIVEPAEGGDVTVEISTEPGMPGWPDHPSGPRVLVEARSWWDTPEIAELRRAGYEIRVCQGPSVPAGRPCPMLRSGACALVEKADVVICLLPHDDPDCSEVAAAHARARSNRLVRRDAIPLRTQVGQALDRRTQFGQALDRRTQFGQALDRPPRT